MRRASLIALLLLAPACRPGTVDLSYRYEAGSRSSYRLEAVADARWDVAGRGSGSYEIAFDVVETVSAAPAGTHVHVEMVPIEIAERGLPSPGRESRSFTLRLGPGDEVVEVLEVDGIPAGALDPDQIAFIGTYRPPLPDRPIGPAASWEVQRPARPATDVRRLVTRGRLEALDADRHGATALISYSGEGPLAWTTTLPQGAAELTGTLATAGEASFDLDRGILRSADSVTSGTFDIRVAADEAQLPITGTLHLRLALNVTAR